MRRIAPLAALAVPLVSMLVGCDDSARPPVVRDTVAIGTLPAELATTPTVESSVPTSEDERGTRTDPPATDEPATDEPAATDESAPPERTEFAEVLAGLVEGDSPRRVETTTFRDDTGRLRMAVPREWSDHRTEPSRLADGSETPSLAASPDLTRFLDGYGTPGLTALVVSGDPDDALGAYTFGEDCTAGRRGPVRTPEVEGRFEAWESCGGTINDIVTLAVRPDGADESVLLLVQVVGPEDLVGLDEALSTLTLGD